MRMLSRCIFLTALLVWPGGTLPAQVGPNGSGNEYRFGLRSTVMLGAMDLNRLHPSFENLESGDAGFSHASGFYLMKSFSRRFALGVETLVGNSYDKKDTQVQIQAAGAVAEFAVGGKLELAGGMMLGGVIASVARELAPTNAGEPGVYSAIFFKGSGLLAAPYLRGGVWLGEWNVGLVARRAIYIPGAEGLSRFDATYAGLSIAKRL